jgi:hypothetical protein
MRILALSALLLATAAAPATYAPATHAPASYAPAHVARHLDQLVARAVDPVGTFDYSTVFQGQDASGTITITSSGGKYGGEMTISLAPDAMPITEVKVEGDRVTVDSVAPDGAVQTVLQFSGDDFTGEWHYGGMTGALKGKRRAR